MKRGEKQTSLLRAQRLGFSHRYVQYLNQYDSYFFIAKGKRMFLRKKLNLLSLT